MRKPREFQAVYAEGRRFAGNLVVVYRRVRPGPTRVGISVGRKVGKAVVRNRLRRRIREILRLLPLRPDQEVVVVARSQAAQASWEGLRAELTKLLGSGGALEPAGLREGARCG
ncbi:MAG: ribonuclease P protein component [Armatimonadota bacterium]|nr:ribonuclease P protein component [Armatimonadota bacterium]MDR7570270.1 ribonuclease P protein component [Armatimonadota bacterium]